ncbi:tRNA-intron endonuclease catalytic domain-like protein, partial [Martensiomyces pterosporus]
NIFWPVLVPCKVDAAVHIIRATDGSAKPVDCVVWVSRRWEVLWRGGSFGKGILSRSNPTWVQRYHKETDPSTSAGTNYLEDITRQRREERRARRTEEIADEERGTGLAIVPAAELQVSSDEVRQMEPVQLSPYEALFLAEIGCLVVKDADNRTYQYADLWQLFRSVDMSDEFDLRYAAYYYYRSKGWVVKSGLKFASDFLLYANGPAHAHSQYSVVVRPLSAEKAGQGEAQEPVDLVDSWQYAFALSRVTSQVKKSLITCYVERPPTSCGHRPDEGPPDLSLYHIREFQIQRFNPNR